MEGPGPATDESPGRGVPIHPSQASWRKALKEQREKEAEEERERKEEAKREAQLVRGSHTTLTSDLFPCEACIR